MLLHGGNILGQANRVPKTRLWLRQAMMVRERSANGRNIKAPGRRLHVSPLALSIAHRPLAFLSYPPFRQ